MEWFITDIWCVEVVAAFVVPASVAACIALPLALPLVLRYRLRCCSRCVIARVVLPAVVCTVESVQFPPKEVSDKVNRFLSFRFGNFFY